MPITILLIGDGKKPLETKANVPSKVITATFLLLNMPSASFEVFKLTLSSFNSFHSYRIIDSLAISSPERIMIMATINDAKVSAL